MGYQRPNFQKRNDWSIWTILRGKKVLPAQDGCRLISLACKAAENFRKSQQCAEIESENNYANYFNELNITFRLLHIIQMSVSPFRQSVDGLDHMRHYLVTDYEPDNLLCWRDYHPSMKNLRTNVEACLECIDDMVTFCKEGRATEMGVSKFNEQKRQRHYFIQQYERFFGELGHMKGIVDVAEARRREVVGLGMHTFQQIFELIQTSRHSSKEKLKKTEDLLVKNTPQTSFDLRIRIFISFALSTLDDTGDLPAEDVYRMVQQLGEVSDYDDLYGLLFLMMFHWPVSTGPRRYLGRHSLIQLCRDIHMRWESKYRKYADSSRQQTRGKLARRNQMKPPTYFFLGNGTGLRQFVHISEINETIAKIDSGALGDTFWTQPIIRRRLIRLEGSLYNTTSLNFRTPDEKLLFIKLAIPTRGVASQEKVSFYLGFSWAGPVAYYVTTKSNEPYMRTFTFGRAYPIVGQQRTSASRMNKVEAATNQTLTSIDKQLEEIMKLEAEKQSGRWLTKEEVGYLKEINRKST